VSVSVRVRLWQYFSWRYLAFVWNFEVLNFEFVSNFEFRASDLFFLFDLKTFDAQFFFFFFGEFRDRGGFQVVHDGFRRRPDNGCTVI